MIRRFVFALLHIAARKVFRFQRFGARSIIKPFPRQIAGAKYVEIGNDCFFGDGLVLIVSALDGNRAPQPTCTFGNRCVFGSDAFISCTKSIVIGNDVLTSSRVYIGDSYHGYSDPSVPIIHQKMEGAAPIRIGDGCFLGIGCAILPGVKLGRNCVVGANAVVTRSFDDYTVIAGVPARAIKYYDRDQERWVPYS